MKNKIQLILIVLISIQFNFKAYSQDYASENPQNFLTLEAALALSKKKDGLPKPPGYASSEVRCNVSQLVRSGETLFFEIQKNAWTTTKLSFTLLPDETEITKHSLKNNPDSKLLVYYWQTRDLELGGSTYKGHPWTFRDGNMHLKHPIFGSMYSNMKHENITIYVDPKALRVVYLSANRHEANLKFGDVYTNPEDSKPTKWIKCGEDPAEKLAEIKKSSEDTSEN